MSGLAHALERLPGRSTTPQPQRHRSGPAPAPLATLQRLAGNAAVTSLLRKAQPGPDGAPPEADTAVPEWSRSELARDPA
jgi:hypothetical protein